MQYGNGRPNISNKKLVRVCLALTILAWATQVLFKQWGYGAEVTSNLPAELPAAENAGAGNNAAGGPRALPTERFVAARPSATGVAVGATLELRAEATINGPEVRLKQISRWSARDAEFFRAAGELVLVRMDAKGPYRIVDLAEVRQTLSDAGVNLAMVRFAGAMSCAINRSDTKPDPDAALAKWIDAREQAGNMVAKADHAAALPMAGSISSTPIAAARPAPTKVEVERAASNGVRSLRELLNEDLSVRLNVPVEQLQVTFNPKDERLLNLCEPQFRFNLDPQYVRNLGEVSWNVTVVANGGTQKAPIVATARAWQTQVVVNRSIPTQAPIRAEDIVERRTLVDRLPDEPVLTIAQSVGQQAARELRPGMVLIGRMVEAVPLARVGQLVTVHLSQGAIRVKSVARAMEGGSMGQRIRVKNEATNDFYDVVLTGPQEAMLGDGAK